MTPAAGFSKESILVFVLDMDNTFVYSSKLFENDNVMEK